jgi:hypothetical protein
MGQTASEKMLETILENKAKKLLSYIHRIDDKEKQLQHIITHFRDISHSSMGYGYRKCEIDNMPENSLDNDHY